MNFDTAVQIILDLEGRDKLTNHPSDPGGLTKFGISKRAHPDVDVENLTEQAAIQIYRRQYWDAVRCEEFPAIIRLALFDSAVNQGAKQATWCLQTALGVKVDGDIGPKTLAAAASANGKKLLERFLSQRANHYMSLDHFQKWGAIWMRRLFHVCIHSEAT